MPQPLCLEPTLQLSQEPVGAEMAENPQRSREIREDWYLLFLEDNMVLIAVSIIRSVTAAILQADRDQLLYLQYLYRKDTA